MKKRLGLALTCCLILAVLSVTCYAATANNNHMYRIFTGHYSWEDAQQACADMGGHLVTITSAEEQAYIEQLNTSNESLWIGGYRDDNFIWYWVTGETWSYTHWGDGEPNNMGDEKYACVWPQYWNDLCLDSGEQNGYICEWDTIATYTITFNANGGNVSPTTKTVTSWEAYGSLPVPTKSDYYFVGWYTDSTAGTLVTANTIVNLTGNQTLYARWSEVPANAPHTYEIIAGNYTWEEANADALSRGGHLVTITSAEEQALVINYMESNNTGLWFRDLWIGAYRYDTSAWCWVNGETWDYTNWRIGEPSNGSEKYACLEGDSWNDLDELDHKEGYICEWDSIEFWTVGFDANGGVLEVADKPQAVGQPYGTLPVPSRIDYLFDGWYTALDGGDLISAQSIFDRHEDQTLYAHWSIDPWTPEHTYKIFTGHYTWDEAKQACADMGGYLATITGPKEQTYIERLNTSNESLWIGGYRDDSFNWYWVTGEAWNYTHWGDGEPNNMGDEKYACVWPQYWNDLCLDSGEQNGFICEWDNYIAVESVSLNQASLTLKEGESATLTATVLPADATIGTLIWESSNPNIAKVINGVVTAVGPGTATIKVTTETGASFRTCTVKVIHDSQPQKGTLGDQNEFNWDYDNTTETITVSAASGTVSNSMPVLVANYDADGRMISMELITVSDSNANIEETAQTVKLFWISSAFIPLSSNAAFQP